MTMKKTPPSTFAEYVAAVARGEPGIANDFHEGFAMDVFQKRCGLVLPWHNLRRGDPNAKEPDFVVEQDGRLVAAFELTEIEDGEVRELNAALARKVAGEPPRPVLTNNPEKRKIMFDRADHVEHTYQIVAGNEKLEKIQHFLLCLSKEELVDLIVTRLEAKKTKPYHQQSDYPVHLIIYERDCIICRNEKTAALCRAGEQDKGNFAAVWYLESNETLTRF